MKDIAAHCTTGLRLKPRYIKPMVRANDALGKTRHVVMYMYDIVHVSTLYVPYTQSGLSSLSCVKGEKKFSRHSSEDEGEGTNPRVGI